MSHEKVKGEITKVIRPYAPPLMGYVTQRPSTVLLLWFARLSLHGRVSNYIVWGEICVFRFVHSSHYYYHIQHNYLHWR
jgi:hypothetical protein